MTVHQGSVSNRERERRYAALRSAMREQGMDALVICAIGATGRGRVRYVTDLYLWGGQTFVVLPQKGDPVMIQPAFVGSEWAESTSWVSDNRSVAEPAQAVTDCLSDMALDHGDIGIVGMASAITAGDLETLRAGLQDACLRDATAMFEAQCRVKSAEEIRCMRNTSAVLRRAFQAIEAYLAPGISEKQVISEAQRIVFLHGGLDGFAHIGRSGGLPMIRPPTDDIIQTSDCLGFDLEFLGPQGYALESSRYFSFAPPPDAIRRLYDIQTEVFERCLEVIRPGASSYEIYRAADAVYHKYGHCAAGPTGHGPVQFHAHGIGLEFEEPPWVPEHNLVFEPGMVISLHPHLGPEDPSQFSVRIEDNVLITSDGAERLTYQRESWTIL